MATAFMHRPVDDEDIASRSDAPLLISARTRRDVEELARRIHEGGSRASRPFVPIRIQAWPTMPRTIKKRWSAAFTTAAGGSVLLTGVEDMSPAFQDLFAELIDDVAHGRHVAGAGEAQAEPQVLLRVLGGRPGEDVRGLEAQLADRAVLADRLEVVVELGEHRWEPRPALLGEHDLEPREPLEHARQQQEQQRAMAE